MINGFKSLILMVDRFADLHLIADHRLHVLADTIEVLACVVGCYCRIEGHLIDHAERLDLVVTRLHMLNFLRDLLGQLL